MTSIIEICQTTYEKKINDKSTYGIIQSFSK